MFLINPYILQASGSYNPLTQAWATNTGESDTTILDALNTFEQFEPCIMARHLRRLGHKDTVQSH